MQKIVVIGGSGFIGSHVTARLAARGARVIVPTRRFDRAKHLIMLPGVEVIEADVRDDVLLRALLAGADAVINLVGVLHSRPGRPYGPDFMAAHVTLPRRITAACADVGVPRYLHMSALGAAIDGPSMYLRSKADGELAARAAPEVAATIFRPSVVFGAEDQFLNLFARMQKFMPLVALAGADAAFQPIYVGDVAQAFVNALALPGTCHQVYCLGGPRIYTLSELVRIAGQLAQCPRPVLALPPSLANVLAWLTEHLPGPTILSRDNLDSMKIDCVIDPAIESLTADALGIKLTALEAVAPRYLAPEQRFDQYRSRAGR